MLKIDYILLIRHFRRETLDDENIAIITWQSESVINSLTYKRLKNVYSQESLPIAEKKVSNEEAKIWKKIIHQIMEEEKN